MSNAGKKKLENWQKKRVELKKKLHRIEEAINKIEEKIAQEKQEKCSHNFVHEGHGHNDDYYVCSKCNISKWE